MGIKKSSGRKSLKNDLLGKKAPSFTLLDSEGKKVSLSSFKGKRVVLYFFPKSGTSLCTQEACLFRDSFNEYKKLGITLIGITYDTVQELQDFKNEHQLPFILLSDHDRLVAEAYGAHDGFFNRLFTYPKRITFLINEQGIITHIFDRINVQTHAHEILQSLATPVDKAPSTKPS